MKAKHLDVIFLLLVAVYLFALWHDNKITPNDVKRTISTHKKNELTKSKTTKKLTKIQRKNELTKPRIATEVTKMHRKNELAKPRTTIKATSTRRKNVLFMISDDIRPQLGCYSGSDSVFNTVKMHTPNLDKLAAKSLLLKKAYAQYALCGPSRASLMTGRRPDTTGVTANDIYWRDIGHNFTTLPQYFKNNGYRSFGFSKIFHTFKDSASWSNHRSFENYEKNFVDMLDGETWMAYSKKNNDKYPLFDITATQSAIEQLESLAEGARSGKEPFFMALGFNKPHLPFICPEEYFQLYPLESGTKYLSHKEWQTPSVRVAKWMHNITEIDGKPRMTDIVLREHRRAYFACISYVDGLVGQVMDALDRLGLTNVTVVSFVADHGYHLGENGELGKKLLTDVSSHVPMIIRIPGQTDNGIRSDSIVESLDLFPTIAQAAGLQVPPICPAYSGNITLCVQGKSLLPLLKRPDAYSNKTAFTQLSLSTVDNYRGYSMRTDRYRYTEYVRIERSNGSLAVYVDPKHLYTELYDHKLDIEETVNRVAEPGYRDLRNKLGRTLHTFIKDSTRATSLNSDNG